jgi:hypothetical protein
MIEADSVEPSAQLPRGVFGKKREETFLPTFGENWIASTQSSLTELSRSLK